MSRADFRNLCLTAYLIAVALDGFAQNPARSHAARAAFIHANPCPSTGSNKPRLSCPGHVVDHRVPLCLGGDDAPYNMQWQTESDGKEKDKDERRACRLQRQSVLQER